MEFTNSTHHGSNDGSPTLPRIDGSGLFCVNNLSRECNVDEESYYYCNDEFSFYDDYTGIEDISTRSLEDLLVFARLAEETENYKDLRCFMRQIAISKPVLVSEEQRLLSIAYKYFVGKRRQAWRSLSETIEDDVQCRDEISNSTSHIDSSAWPTTDRDSLVSCNVDSDEVLTSSLDIECNRDNLGKALNDSGNSNEYMNTMISHSKTIPQPLAVVMGRVRREFETLCFEFIEIVRMRLLPNVPKDSHESIVLYEKLIGDYYRYLAERCPDGFQRREYIREATQFYDSALERCHKELHPRSSLSLSLALNISVFRFEILNKPEKACELAKTTYDSAVVELDGEDLLETNEINMLLDLLRKNLTTWTLSDLPGG